MSLGDAFPIERSDVYQRWMEERAAISTHKWYLSERVGKDVGWDYAQWSWVMTQRDSWLKAQASGEASLTRP